MPSFLVEDRTAASSSTMLSATTTLAAEGGKPDQLMIEATDLKALRTVAGLPKRAVHRHIGRTKGGLNSKFHAVCNGRAGYWVALLSEGQMSDYKDAALVIHALPRAKPLLADRGYDVDWFCTALVLRPSERWWLREQQYGGAAGIRTLDGLLTHTHFPGERLRPLGHRSACTGDCAP